MPPLATTKRSQSASLAAAEGSGSSRRYAIRGPRGSGVACLNGAAAYKGVVGDRLIVMAWCQLDDEERKHHQPRIVRLDERNRIVAAAV